MTIRETTTISIIFIYDEREEAAERMRLYLEDGYVLDKSFYPPNKEADGFYKLSRQNISAELTIKNQ